MQIAYTTHKPRCQLCSWPSFGAFKATFSSAEELVFLCAQCAFARAWSVWHGHMTKKLKALSLAAIFKLPPGDPPKAQVPESSVFVQSDYSATFVIDGERFSAPIGTFSSEWAALERARQISHKVVQEAKRMAAEKAEKLDHNLSVEEILKEARVKAGEREKQRQAKKLETHWSIQKAVTRKEVPNDQEIPSSTD